MNKNRLYLGMSIVSLLLMSLAVINPFTGSSWVNKDAASDLYQQHPELSVSAAQDAIDLTDYYFRHLHP